MKLIPAVLAGILFGFSLLPLPSWAWFSAAALWPLLLVFFTDFRSSSFLRFIPPLFVFIIFKYLTQYFWIWESLFKHSTLSKSYLLLLCSLLILWISIPWLILHTAQFLFAKASGLLKRPERFKLLFIISLPFYLYFTRLIHNINPFYGLPGGEFIEKTILMNHLETLITTIGSNATDLLVTGLILWGVSSLTYTKGRFLTVPFILVLLIFIFSTANRNVRQYDSTAIEIAIIPWSNHLTSNTTSEHSFGFYKNQMEERKLLTTDLIVWPESAIQGEVENGRMLEKIQNQFLKENQNLILGSNKKELGGDKFLYSNSAYLLEGQKFEHQVYKKEFLIPFAEYAPLLFNILKLPMLLDRNFKYENGENKAILLRGKPIAIGICFEGIQEEWYLKRESERPGMYVLINREYLFSEIGKRALLQTAIVKALQTGKPLIRATNGGYSAIINLSPSRLIQIYKEGMPVYNQSISPRYESSFYFQNHAFIRWIIFWVFILINLYFTRKPRSVKKAHS